MIRKQTKLLIALFVGMMYLAALTPNVKATEISSGEIPVTIDLGDSIADSEKEFEIELKGEHPDNPMPEGTIDGVYSIKITGADTKKLPKIPYNKIGEYSYTISQKIEKGESEDFDTKTYLLKVEVTRSETTQRLQAVSTLYVVGQTTKVAGAVFYNAPPPAPAPIPTEKPTTEVKGAEYERPKTSDENQMWPYVVLFISGAIAIGIVILDTKKKVERYNS